MMSKTKLITLMIVVFVFLLPAFLWAGTIQLPQTGQTACYDLSNNWISCAGTGQDGEILAGVQWPDPRFTVTYCDVNGPCANQNADCDSNSSTDVVIDNLTGLMWARNGNLPDGTMTWYQAIDYANNLNLCGYSDWRLSNVNELESLINADWADVATWLNNQGFSNVQGFFPNINNTNYWSSTTEPSYNLCAWYVDMWQGGSSVDIKESDYNWVLPVRAGQYDSPDSAYPANIWKTGQKTSYATGDDGDLERGVAWPVSRFNDHGDGIVTDNLTGLIWTKDANAPGPSICNPGTYKTEQEALDYVSCLNNNSYLGHNDWRLPNRKEIFSLIDYSHHHPALPSGYPFTNVGSQDIWTSTTSTVHWIGTSISDAWHIYMMRGYLSSGHKYGKLAVWPVCSGLVPADASSADDITVLVPDERDQDPIGDRTPLILIHGIHGTKEEEISQPNDSYWSSFLNYFNNDDFKRMYKVYRFHYLSDQYSVWEIARALRNDLDFLIKADKDFDKPFVIVAHSMGGLVARSYMEEHSHYAGNYNGKRGGKRVIKLITLATPHHGTPGQNDEDALEPIYTNGVWDQIFSVSQFFYNVSSATEGSKWDVTIHSTHPNRSDLRWDSMLDPHLSFDTNDWLATLNSNLSTDLSKKIIAYYGYVNPSSIDRLYWEDPLKIIFWLPSIRDYGPHTKLTIASAIMDAGLSEKFPLNDGMVPVQSAAFDGNTVAKQVECPNHDHLYMKDSSTEKCANDKTLFESLKDDLCIIGIPNLNSPSDGDNNVSITPTLDWDDVPGATQYWVEVCSDSNCSSGGMGADVGSSQWTVSPALNQGTQYWWRVTAEKSCGSSWSKARSSAWSFTTTCPTLSTPTGTSPLNGAADVSITPKLDWGDISGATSYNVQICSDSDCSSVVKSLNVTNSQRTISSALNLGTTYYWRVIAKNSCGSSSWSSVWSFTTFFVKPPSQLRAKAISSTQIVLNWIDNSDNELGFKIERKEGACDSANTWKQIAKKGADVITHTSSGLTPNTTYSYQVRAYNADDNSAYSNCALAKTALSGTSKAPSNLKATSVSSSKVNLSWKDNSLDETSFKVYRKVGTGSWTLLTTTDVDAVSYSDTTAGGNTSTTSYSYYVKACNGSGCSPATNIAVVPYSPMNLVVEASAGKVDLTWEDESGNETGFQVYRKSGACSSTNSWSVIETTVPNSTSYSNTGLSSGKTYSYKARAYKKSSAQPYAYGYSMFSNCSSAATP